MSLTTKYQSFTFTKNFRDSNTVLIKSYFLFCCFVTKNSENQIKTLEVELLQLQIYLKSSLSFLKCDFFVSVCVCVSKGEDGGFSMTCGKYYQTKFN